VSSDTQQKEATIESQLFELKKQIAAAGDMLVKEYIDDGYTGTLLDRPALEQMRADPTAGDSRPQGETSCCTDRARARSAGGSHDAGR
jgi:DNA invertase Pin-like site-specific DNA recombinase